MPTRIHTERLLLKALTKSDAEAFYGMIKEDPTWLQESFPMMVRVCTDTGRTAGFLHQKSLQWAQNMQFAFGVYLRESNQLIGYISIKTIDWNIPKCEVGYFVRRKFAGNGYMTESLFRIRDYCLSDLKMIKIFLRIIPSNQGSKKLAAKAG
ncbi:MAG: GNAT family N-acetyltransferase, partial [Bacteroidota bacterium]